MPYLCHLDWSSAEKKVARRAFELAYHRECVAIRERAGAMLRELADAEDIWRVHDCWLNESDLDGLRDDKLSAIRRIASL